VLFDQRLQNTSVSWCAVVLTMGNYEDLHKFLDIDWDLVISSTHEDVEELWSVLKNKSIQGIEMFIPKVSKFAS